jgi:hypothetical protein
LFLTDYSKKATAGIDYNYEYRDNNSALSYELKPGITCCPFKTFKIGLSGDYIILIIFNMLQHGITYPGKDI